MTNKGLRTNSKGPSILRRIPNTFAPVTEITKPLRGFMTPRTLPKYSISSIAESYSSYSKLSKAAITSHYIYSKPEVVYIDTQNQQEVQHNDLEGVSANFKLKPQKVPHSSAYSIPLKLVPQSASPGNSAPLILSVTIDRLELLPGLSGFAIDKASVLYSKVRKMKVHHPLIPENESQAGANRFVPVVGVKDGPSNLTPIYAGNDQNSLDLAIEHELNVVKSVDIHGAVNYQTFMGYIPNLVEENGRMYLKMAHDPENKAAIFQDRNNLPIELANEAIYQYLSKVHGSLLVAVEKINEASHTVPGYLEPVIVTKWFVNAPKVRADYMETQITEKFSHVASLDEFNGVKDFPLVEAGVNGLHAWRFGLESDASLEHSKSFTYRRSSSRVEGRCVLLPWALKVYEESESTGPAKMPVVLEKDEDLLKKLYLMYALNGYSTGTSIVVPQRITTITAELNRKLTLQDLDDLRKGIPVQTVVSTGIKPTPESGARKCSNDMLRGVLIGTLERTKSNSTLNQVVIEDVQGILSLLYYATTYFPLLKGISKNGSSLSAEDFSYVQVYESYILYELSELQQRYESDMDAHDFFSARESVDAAILLIAGKYKPALTCDNLDILSFERAGVCVKVYTLIMKTLHRMVYPFYPDLALHMSTKINAGDGHRLNSPQKPHLLLKDSLPIVLTTDHHHAPGQLMFTLIESIESVLASSNLPRRRYRGYVCTENYSIFGYETRDDLNERIMLLVKRITRVRRLMTPEVTNIFNSGRIKTTKLLDGVYLQSFDDEAWISKEDYKNNREEQKKLREELGL